MARAPLRVGDDAHIVPRPDGREWWVDTYKPTAQTPNSPGGWEVFATQPGPAYAFRCPLHTRRCGGTLSKQERAERFYFTSITP